MAKKINVNAQSDGNLMSFGGLGLRVLNSSSVAGEVFACVQALEDSVISFTSNLAEGDQTVSGLSLPKGMPIYGKITDITFTSGSVVAYLLEVS